MTITNKATRTVEQAASQQSMTHLPIDTIRPQPGDLILVGLAVAGRQSICVAGEPVGEYLAVTPALEGTSPDSAVRFAGDTWTITHRWTGMAVCYIHSSIEHARTVAAMLANTIDWTRPVADLAADPYVRDAITAAIGAPAWGSITHPHVRAAR